MRYLFNNTSKALGKNASRITVRNIFVQFLTSPVHKVKWSRDFKLLPFSCVLFNPRRRISDFTLWLLSLTLTTHLFLKFILTCKQNKQNMDNLRGAYIAHFHDFFLT